MLAIEFESVIQNGVIKLPENYADWQEKSVKVILLVQEDSSTLRRRKPGSAKGMIEISADFDAPLESFEDYMP